MSLADLAGGILIATTRLLCGPQARWVGCEPSTRQRIYFANHCSHLDAVVLWSCLPPPVRRQTRPVAALDYWGGGGLKGFLAGEVFHSILVDRSGANPRSVIDHLVESMGPTSSIIFFPEETRGAGQEVLPGAPSDRSRSQPQQDLGGILSATLLGSALWWATPFTPLQAAGMSLVITLLGFSGGLVMSAIKRDRGIKDFGTLIAGHGGILDRIDSICFAAPVFFHLTRFFFT
jgi:hypothetical protein